LSDSIAVLVDHTLLSQTAGLATMLRRSAP
jgi:hypothetical protein